MSNTYPNGGNIYPNPTSGGGGGATALTVISGDGTVVQNGLSSYDSGTQTITVDLAATASLNAHSPFIAFNQLTDAPFNNNYQFSAYGDGIFLTCTAAGDGTGVLSYTIDNGKTWITGTPINAGITKITGIAYGNGTWVIVGDAGQYAYSYNLTIWQNSFFDMGINSVNDITFGNGYFVVVGNGGQCSTSTDGNNWVPITLPSSDDYTNIAYADFFGFGNPYAPTFVAISINSGSTAYSITNGQYWQSTTPLPITTYTAAKLCASPTLFLLIDTGGGTPTNDYMYFDYFGVWTDGSANPFPTAETWSGAAYDPINRVFLLFGSDGFSTTAVQGVLSSPDSSTYSLTWSSITQPQAAKWLTPVYGAFGFMSFNTLNAANAYFAFWSFAPQIDGEAGNNQIVSQNDLAIGLNFFAKKLPSEGNPVVSQLVSFLNNFSYSSGNNQVLKFDTIVGSGMANLYNTISGNFVVPYSGIYLIQLQGQCTSNSVTALKLISIIGAFNYLVGYTRPLVNNSSGSTDSCVFSTCLTLVAGAQFQVQFDANASGDWEAGVGAQSLYTTNIMVTFIG
jgi:hypothetical protein